MDAFCGVAVCLAVLGGTPDGVLLDFSAKWCGPCQSMEPTVHRLQQQGFPIRQIDADASPAVLQRYGVTGLPTFVLIVRGREVERISGAVSESTLRRMLAKIPEKSDPKPEPVRATNLVTIAGVQTEPPPKAPGLMASLKSLIKLPLPAAKGPQSVSLDEPAGVRAATVIRANSSDEAAPSIATDPLLGCTRIRVKDSHGLDVGSGTIIHSEPGRTLILTCGHLFRHFDKQGQIKVDIFGPKPQTLDGTLIRHNLDQDIGLISVSPLETLPVVPIAEQAVAARDHVFSIGCGGGDDPTKLQHLVTSTTKYRDFVECTGTPIQGRSGGGLFTRSGKLAGVCVFADPAARRGLYAGLDTISRLLEQCGLSWLQPDSAIASNGQAPEPLFEGDFAAADDAAARFDRMPTLSGDALEAPPFANEVGPLASEQATSEGSQAVPSDRTVGEFGLEDLIPTVDDSAFSDAFADSAIASVPENSPIATLDNLTAMSEMLEPPTVERATSAASELSLAGTKSAPRRPIVGPSVESLRSTLEAARGAEVVCIVRDRENPEAPSRIVVINRASRQFVKELTGELSQQVQPTSKVIPASRRASTEVAASEKPQRYRRRIR
jgi:thiol-disulfide isomerase/thioredoxin